MKKIISVLVLISSFSLLMAREKVFQHEEFSASSVKNIAVEASSGNVKIISEKGSKVIVETYSKKARVADIKITLSGDTLSLDATCWTMSKFPPNVRIFVPNDFSFGDLDIKISSGNIDIENVNCAEMNINMTSGNLDIDDSNLSGDIKIKSTSGNVNLDDVVCANFNAKMTSGNIDAENISCKVFDASSTSGKIECEDLNCEMAQVAATSGNIDVEFLNLPSQKSSLKAFSGNVFLTLPKDNKGYTAIVSTNSGKFTDEFTGVTGNNFRGIDSSNKSGGVEIELSTKSGNIKIQKSRRNK